jgi:hypothetical protein
MLVAGGVLATSVSGSTSATVPDRQSLTVLLVVDVSASMSRHVEPPSRLEIVTDAFLAALAPGDRAWFGRVAGSVAFTGMFERASTYLDDQVEVFATTAADRYGPSPLWDALDAAVGKLEGQAGRRAVIVWTDGRASGNQVGLREVVARAQRAGVAISVACVPTDEFIPQTPTTAVRVRPSLYLEWMAATTGGVFQRVLAADATARVVGDIMDRLREPVVGQDSVLR